MSYVSLIASPYGRCMYDIATDHAPALGAAIVLLGFLWVFLTTLRLLGRRGSPWASQVVAPFDRAQAATKLAALLMLLSGAIHLALVPGHDGITGILFIIDGVGFIGLGIAAVLTTWWRSPAILWLSATIVAYVIWVVAGWETPDQVGIACKLIELVALGLVLRLNGRVGGSWLKRAWRATAFPLVAVLTTLGIWVGGLAHPDALHAHAGALLQPVAAVATPEERASAAQLLAATRASIARYQDPAAAIAAGFKPGPVSSADPLRHFENKANANAILDPQRPQALVYAQTPYGLRLIGAMYQMPRLGQWGPDPGGPLTQWHQHEGICFSPFGIEFSFETPFWTCPVGSTSITTPPMLHVWVIDNGKNGPFAADLDKTVQRELTGRS
jgi:hypothetical protein